MMTEAKNGLGQKNIKGATRDCFPFGSWFASNSSAETVMYVGSDMIGIFVFSSGHRI